jgi:hypothetical protein
MTRIRLIAETSFGHKDDDLSVEVPDKGELTEILDCKNLPKIEPKRETFTEYLGETGHRINSHMEESFPAVEMRPFYMLWMENRGEWVGIKFSYLGSTSELDGVTEYMETGGPYRLDRGCAKLIKRAYKSRVPLENIIHTPPSELKISKKNLISKKTGI